jgi:hypothetical protein
VLALERLLQKFLQHISVPGDYSISPGLSEFCFSWFDFFNSRSKRGVRGEVLVPSLSIAAGKAAHARFAIVRKCAFENQMIFCTTVDSVF